MSQALVTQIYQACLQISPYLKGEQFVAPADSIASSQSNSNIIKLLHSNIAQQSPEAGKAYWLTRSWDLLIWQPLYIAMVSIYQLRTLPDLTSLIQRHQHGLVAGFYLTNLDCLEGDDEALIAAAGKQLTALFEHYRRELDLWVRCRPRFVEHLIADAILAKLELLQQAHPESSNAEILRHAKLWLYAFNLPTKHLQSLTLSSVDNKLILQRTSCCAVYKTTNGVKCDNCPRLTQKSKTCIN
ncbi:siderophore ferric iron reductase [Shewanella fidelis]|uniref:Siderophore ferric iron reductase n=1 Tax=Shewanella fidelis TaxID=173509 RepID=A0AAW8NSL7_9GAMM|nr:siderophore ferric iron reductase [Shewanella fidelis]MDR8526108.1 siderophore ferric iron reductase [Shewanella fidelis]MDW4813721.1 siderophore ferric iron reductase [Shewanella fidelis]MDW4817817.1 siderophore ferric iron reductase [Shewanella fidelis]MDW4821922.1 siderophore ferric iron reductase [Shewanella fidelis]MDW4826049.1 siderophore ferric iron reductase [Shewanella fidelis]